MGCMNMEKHVQKKVWVRNFLDKKPKSPADPKTQAPSRSASRNSRIRIFARGQELTEETYHLQNTNPSFTPANRYMTIEEFQ